VAQVPRAQVAREPAAAGEIFNREHYIKSKGQTYDNLTAENAEKKISRTKRLPIAEF